MLRVRTPLDALGRRCSWTALLQDCSIDSCKVVASTEKTEVLLDGSVARLVASTEKTEVLLDGSASTEKKLGCRLNGEDNVSTEKTIGQFLAAFSQTWRGGFNDHQLLPIHCIPSWCLRNKPPNNTEEPWLLMMTILKAMAPLQTTLCMLLFHSSSNSEASYH